MNALQELEAYWFLLFSNRTCIWRQFIFHLDGQLEQQQQTSIFKLIQLSNLRWYEKEKSTAKELYIAPEQERTVFTFRWT